MNKYKRFVPIVAIVLVALGVNLDQFGIDLEALVGGSNSSARTSSSANSSDSNGGGHPSYKQWSDTNPEINLWHIFEGEINRSGKPVGFHSRHNGKDPANARVVDVRDGPNSLGIYTATIEIRDGNKWKEKFSSFFPNSMSQSDVIDAVLHAYKNSENPNAQPWDGPSGHGFRVQGYSSSRGGLNTAFPVYVRNP